MEVVNLEKLIVQVSSNSYIRDNFISQKIMFIFYLNKFKKLELN